MELSEKKAKQLREQPIIETRVWKSKKGEHIVFQTLITEIKPVSYMEKVMAGDPEEGAADEPGFETAEV